MSAQREAMAKTRLDGYGTLLPSKWKEIYEHVDSANTDDRPLSARNAAGVPDQVHSVDCDCHVWCSTQFSPCHDCSSHQGQCPLVAR